MTDSQKGGQNTSTISLNHLKSTSVGGSPPLHLPLSNKKQQHIAQIFGEKGFCPPQLRQHEAYAEHRQQSLWLSAMIGCEEW